MVKSKYYNLDTDSTLGGNNASDIYIPSQKAVKAYVDEKISSDISTKANVSLNNINNVGSQYITTLGQMSWSNPADTTGNKAFKLADITTTANTTHPIGLFRWTFVNSAGGCYSFDILVGAEVRSGNIQNCSIQVLNHYGNISDYTVIKNILINNFKMLSKKDGSNKIFELWQKLPTDIAYRTIKLEKLSSSFGDYGCILENPWRLYTQSTISPSSYPNFNSTGYTVTTPTLNYSIEAISDLIDDTATYPIDKADTLTGLTATISELNIMDGVTATASEINVLDGITATTTELNYVDGVTSAIQTQLNGKADVDLSNINASASAKNTINSWGMPDYSAGVSWSTPEGSTWTAPYDCFISAMMDQNCRFWVRKDNSSGIVLNSLYVNLAQSGANTFPVPKGTVLWVENFLLSLEGNVTIYPLKGAS